MLIYNELKNKSREFLTATGLKLDEFEKLLPAFQTAYEQQYPPHLTQAGKTRQRQIGGGATGALPKSDDKLFFILVYQKTHPLQTMHGLQFGLSQPQAHAWIHRLLPVLQQALRPLGEAPERDARRVATRDLARAGAPDLTIDGSERRRQRPKEHAKQKEHYSGKKKPPTDKNLLLVNANTKKVAYLSPTVAGTTHDKQATDDAQSAYPHNATLDKDTGLQGYEPTGTQTRQPQKSPKAKS
jgi:Helix-turn-helix of DDE superfamily endonuclease/DDE superfamily endonuclease